ncbi:PadR family transcriptional regulator [Actinoalloteichus sp. AHMU CJ021]|uniref:DNA-binding transcriptional regulator, PadR family n=1 Tax=Actinoalloteichus caeruleus DSM 43889 TaxID=1120930 RepID=A0ABT1JFK1_ACTCY|nr:PadR family transcriptional regulator [Actinoalloteichus caeruleus]AUS81073.1 PadR family transcriptional regulator [Actinoalloteichus sp. AHMU CJ021]MCP2330566.1 DNA-binding transcriptional regulator, PadR family [Actinoalloteichus caeruleus DSM 43889]
MAHVILGLLLIAPQSFYALVRAFEASVTLFYSASSGSIKRALDGLLTRELVEVASTQTGGRGKKTYQVTEAGRREFRAWMTGELAGRDLESAALSRLYFLGLVEPSERVAVLRRIEARVEHDLAKFSRLDEQLDTVKVPEGLTEVAASQRATLAYGIASLQFMLDWFRDHAERLDGTPPDQARTSREHGRRDQARP